MRMIMFADGGAVSLAAITLNSADAARNGRTATLCYGGSEFHHNKIHAEACAVRAWRSIRAHTHGVRAAVNNLMARDRASRLRSITSPSGLWMIFQTATS